MGAPGVVKWEEWMSVPRMRNGENKVEGGEAAFEWTLEQDAAGRIKAVKRFTIDHTTTKEAVCDRIEVSKGDIEETTKSSESISVEQHAPPHVSRPVSPLRPRILADSAT